MNQDLGLKVLGHIMAWSNEEARKEFEWLKLMARLKYDGYRDFHAGMRFIERLATWLQQFNESERKTAYAFIRNMLVYIGPSEMLRLVQQFFPSIVQERIKRIVADERDIKFYRVLADSKAQTAAEHLRRQTLFMGLSDGARIDAIRHSNTGSLSNEQFVQGTQVDPDKWEDLLINLRKDLEDQNARFRLVYLIDDFAGTGMSFLRFDKEKSHWTGKFMRFRDSLERANEALDGDRLTEEGWQLCVHHYVASHRAAEAIRENVKRATDSCTSGLPEPHVSFGMILPKDLPINAANHCNRDFVELTQTYYDPAIQTKHTAVGGKTHVGLGFGGCALPLVLEHNTPNNSVALLWAETVGRRLNSEVNTPAMRPLFRRRQRHT